MKPVRLLYFLLSFALAACAAIQPSLTSTLPAKTETTISPTAEKTETSTSTATEKANQLSLNTDWQNVETVKAHLIDWDFYSSQEYNDQVLEIYKAGGTAQQIPDTAQWINWQITDFSKSAYTEQKYGFGVFFDMSNLDLNQGTYLDRTKIPFIVADIAHTPLNGDDGYYSATYVWEGQDQIPYIVKRVAYIGDYSNLEELLADLTNQDPSKLPFPIYIPNAKNCPTDPRVPNPGQAYCNYYAAHGDVIKTKMVKWGADKNVPMDLFEPLYFLPRGVKL